MLQIPISALDIEPGHVVEWRLRSSKADRTGADGAGASRREASFNQDKHFAAAQESRGERDPIASWVATTFEIEGRLDRQALESAFFLFVRRHEVLRCEFERLIGDLTCEPLKADDIALEPFEAGHADSTGEVRAYLAEQFEKQIDTLSWPLFVMGAVVREHSATVYLAFDHLVTDGLSMPIAVNDVATAYRAIAGGREVELPEVGSYVDFGHRQRARYLSMGIDDSRLDYWKGFIARGGDFFPRFPLDLGVEPGRLYPAVNEADQLLDGAEAEQLEAHCRDAGGSLFMGTLAALGVSLRRAGGPGVYRGLMPVSERGRGELAHSMGWYVNTMPIEFSVAEGRELPEVLAGVRDAFAELLRHSGVPFVRAWQLLAPHYAELPCWPYPVNFFSYIDFRKVPGVEKHEDLRPTMHVWASRSNGISFWFHRNTTGLHVNSMFPDTPRAHETSAALRRLLRETVAGVARSGTI
jgi:condensation domain-containing protein